MLGFEPEVVNNSVIGRLVKPRFHYDRQVRSVLPIGKTARSGNAFGIPLFLKQADRNPTENGPDKRKPINIVE